MDVLETLSESWPLPARTLLNEVVEGAGAGPYVSFVPKRQLETRKKFNAVWIGLVCFLAYSEEEGTLAEMGQHLGEEQMNDILDVIQDMTPIGDEQGLGDGILHLVIKALGSARATPSDNVVVWWVAILVRSAVSSCQEEDGADFISQGQFSRNILPMDIGLRERVQAIVHYSKVLLLDLALRTWEGRPRQRSEVINDIDLISRAWLDEEDGRRPVDTRTCSSDSWRGLLGHLQEHMHSWISPAEKRALQQVMVLSRTLKQCNGA